MAGYTRQSSMSDGDTITAALFNNEYNQIVNAFNNSTGHKHDGTTAEGPVIGLIGDAGETSPNNKVLIDTTNNYIEFYVEVSSSPVQQLYIADGAIVPVTDNDIDLGTSSLEFKDLYLDGTATIDTLTVDGAATVGTTLGVTGATTLSSTLAVTGTSTLTGNVTTTNDLSVGGNLTVTGNATIAGNLTFGDAATDTVAFSADVASNLLPSADNTYDLGASGSEWKDLYVDGIAYVDAINFNGTAITSTAAELNILDGVTSTATELNIVDGDTAATSTTLADADRVVVNDAGTMVQVALTDFETYFESALDTLSNVTTVGALNAGSITSGFGSIDNGSSTITTTGLISGGSLAIDDVVINGSTIGHTDDTDLITVANGIATIAGELSVTTLDIGGTNVTSTAAELNILDGVTSTAAELNILDGVTSTTAELNILDGVTSTAAELNILDGVTSTATELNLLDGVTATTTELNYVDVTTAGTVEASKAIITDANKDITGGRNITITGELDAATLDISGDADIDGTLEADAITIAGITLAETISDTVGAMVSSNTETNITVTYDDTDNTLDFVIGTLNQDTTGNAATATALETARTIHGVSFDGTANIDLTEVVQDTVGGMVSSNTESGITVTYQDADGTLDFTVGTLNQDTTGTADNITVTANNSTDETVYPIFVDGATGSQGAESDTGLTYNPSSGILTATQFTGNVTGDVTGNVSGTAATVTGAAQSNITSLGTLTTLTVDNVIINGTTIGHTSDTDLMTLASGVLTVAGEVDATSLDISGDIDVDGTANLDNTDIDGTLNTSGVVTCQTSANISQVAITSSSNSIAWDAAAAANAYHVTTENTTFAAPSNATEGAIISVEIAQGGTARTIAWNTVFEFAASTAPTITATANKTDILAFRYNGSVWQEIGRVQNLAQT